jgi:hypothetical protein
LGFHFSLLRVQSSSKPLKYPQRKRIVASLFVLGGDLDYFLVKNAIESMAGEDIDESKNS